MTAPQFVVPKHGHGLLQHGSKKGRRARLVSKTFKEVSEMLLTDPDVQDALRRRVLLELAGKRRNPLPLVAVLAAAAEGQKAKAGSERGSVVFAVSIQGGRGHVERIDEPEALALPEANGKVE